jgi:peptidoglycan/xylan/chitin deacetylase (PgdA/CDA1 family)
MARLIVTTSWDDGSVIDLRLGALLTKYGMKGTFYIPNYSNRVTILQNDELRELAAVHEIGGHSITHPHLTMIPQPEARTEIEGNKLYLEAVLGKKIRMFGYPFGEFNEETKTILRACGYIGARTVKFNGLSAAGDPYEFGVAVTAVNSRKDYAAEILQYFPMIPTPSLSDWEGRAKTLFDLAVAQGGVFHLWGHSWQIEENNDWDKLERVLKYISNKAGVLYISNGETIDMLGGGK